MSWYSENITDPISDVGRDIVGDDVADVLSSYGGFIEKATEDAGEYLSLEYLSDVDPANLLEPYKEAADEAQNLALSAAELEMLSTAESVRILEEENARTMATARARAGASGLSGASTELYISALEESGQQDVDWLKIVGAKNYESRITEGRLAEAQAEGQMWSTGASLVGIGTGLAGLFV